MSTLNRTPEECEAVRADTIASGLGWIYKHCPPDGGPTDYNALDNAVRNGRRACNTNEVVAIILREGPRHGAIKVMRVIDALTWLLKNIPTCKGAVRRAGWPCSPLDVPVIVVDHDRNSVASLLHRLSTTDSVLN